MQYTTLGDTGLVVSRLAFGAMTFTAGNSELGAVYKVGAELADRLVGRALEAGINFFDTADMYATGESETLLGRALRPHRDDVVIATKVGYRTGKPLTRTGLSRRHILWSIDESLRRLGTDWVDVYIVHREDLFTPLEETLSALDAVVRSGKARYLGFSNWSAWKAAAAMEIQRAHGLAPFTHGQMNYTLVGRDAERDVIPMMRAYRLGMTIWSPLAGGFLSGKYTPDAPRDAGDRLATMDILPFDRDRGFALIDTLRIIADAHDATVAQIALAWLLSKPAVTSILLGATKFGQLEDNLGAVAIGLSDKEIAELDAAMPPAPAYPNWAIDRQDAQVAEALAHF